MIADDDDFVDLVPTAKAPASTCAITFGTVSLRGGVEKISLSFAADVIAKLEGWPRFNVAWSVKTMVLRIRAGSDGVFEAYKAVKGSRYVLRTTLPAELQHVHGVKEPAPYRFSEDGRTVLITAPPCFRKPPPKPSQAEIVEAAKRAVPAPTFSRPGGATVRTG